MVSIFCTFSWESILLKIIKDMQLDLENQGCAFALVVAWGLSVVPFP